MKIVHYAFVLSTKAQLPAIAISKAAATEVQANFTLTLRLPDITRCLPHISILSVLVEDEVAEDQLRLRFMEEVRTAKLDGKWLSEINIEMTRARYVEDLGYLQIITDHPHFVQIHELAIAATRSVQMKSPSVRIVSDCGDKYRPHLTLSHSDDVQGIQRLAAKYTEEQHWGDEVLRLRTVEVTRYEVRLDHRGTFPGGREIISNPYS